MSELHEVIMSAVVVKDGKYLIIRRSKDKKHFPLKWTIPGGRLETGDYTSLRKQTREYWYNVLETTLRREVKEETSLKIDNIRYVTSMATIHPDGTPSLVITCLADHAGGEVKLQLNEADDFAWIIAAETGKYDLIDGISDEIRMADDYLKTGRMGQWHRQ